MNKQPTQLVTVINLQLLHAVIQSCCATTNEGVQEGLAWIKSQITTKKTAQAVIKPLKDTVQDAQKEAITVQLLGAFKSLFVSMGQS